MELNLIDTNNLQSVTSTKNPATTLIYAFNHYTKENDEISHKQLKENYVRELLGRTWKEGKPLWTLETYKSQSIPTNISTFEIITASLQSMRSKMDSREFKNTTRSFRYRCGEGQTPDEQELESTYIWLTLHNDFLNKMQKKHRLRKKSNGSFQYLNMAIQKVSLLLANDSLCLLIIEMEHKTKNVAELIADIHPLQKAFLECYISVRSIVPKEHLSKVPTDNTDYGYLTEFLTPAEEDDTDPHYDANPCPLVGFFGWLLYEDWDCPTTFENPAHSAEEDTYFHYTKLMKTSFLYRMHHVELSAKDWNLYKAPLAYYLRRGTKIETQHFPMDFQFNSAFVTELYRNWNHLWSMSRDGLVSIACDNETPYNFTEERFYKSYQILTLQVLIEYLGCTRFNYQVSKIAFRKKDKDKLRNLMERMDSFRLGINLVDFSRRTSEASYYASLRTVFTIEPLLAELSEEVKDVWQIINQITREEDSKAKDKAEKESESRKDAEELRQKKQDTILSIIGATTIPFAILSGLMGMNTNLQQCGDVGGIGQVPCMQFSTVVILCFFLGAIIYGICQKYLLSEKMIQTTSNSSNA